MQNKYNALNEQVYIYPLALYKEPTLFEKFRERLLLSEKPIKKKVLINNNYHHLCFKTHSKSIFSNSNIINKKNPNQNSKNIKGNNKEYNSKKKRLYNTFYNQENNDQKIKLRKNYSSSIPFRFENDNKVYQKIYLSEVEKRGFNYSKLKLASIQRKAMRNFIKFDNNDFDYNQKASYILETNKRQFFPQMKKFLINKYLYKNNNNDYTNEEKISKFNKSQAVINIKNNPSFKFHIFHDQKGKEKKLEKPCIRTLKMTLEKMRDIKVMSKINKINDPEIIQMYKSVI